MLGEGEDEVVCDLAQTYHIYNMREYPLDYIATLVNGLESNSRIKRKIANIEVDLFYLLGASILDNLSFIAWTKTKDAKFGRNKPKSMVETLIKKHDSNDDIMTFDTAEDFEKMRQEIIRSKT